MLSRDYTLKLNEWITNFTGNQYGKTPFGNLSEILMAAFPTDAEIKPFLIRAYASSPRWLFLWKQGTQLVDFNGKVYDENILNTSAHVYPLQNKLGITIYAVDPNLKSSQPVDNTASLPDYLKGKEGTQEYFDYINSVTQKAGFEFNTTTILIIAALLFLGLSKVGK